MKKNFITGFLSGALIFGTIGALAAGLIATPNTYPVQVNGSDVSVEGYNINDYTYFKLRDVADAVGGFDVGFNNDTIVLTTDKEQNQESQKEDETVAAKLLYQGHGSVKLTLATGEVVYIDPYAGEGYDDEADLILVTHQHQDHNKIDLPPHAENCVIFQNSDAIGDDGYQSLDIYGLHIEPVQAYNRNHDVTQCVGYLVTVGDKLLYFAGDTSKTDQMSELKDRNIDYAFLPMDGRFNMDVDEAIECAELIQAKHTVPYHMSPGSLFDADRAALFDTPSALIIEAGEEIEL